MGGFRPGRIACEGYVFDASNGKPPITLRIPCPKLKDKSTTGSRNTSEIY
jgi:hypothetical protein